MPRAMSVSVRFGVAITLCMLAALATAEETVSEWNRFRFVANQTFSDEQLLDALVREADFLLATHPHGEPANLRETTRRLY
jgi:hypothetical protein